MNVFDFLDYHTFLLVVHIFGVALGAGGAFMTDLIFFSSIRDEKLDHTEIKFLKLGSRVVWTGLIVLIISGAGLFLLNTERYLESSKFLAKMTVVAVILVNGIIFHLNHILRIERHTGEHYPSSDEFMRKRSLILASGVVSMVSWASALILGVLRGIPYSYWQILSVYLGITAIGIVSSLILKNKIFPHHDHKR